jgi:primase-polymerase (primpol)-like protein
MSRQNVPDFLCAHPHWVLWKFVLRFNPKKGHQEWTKPPLQRDRSNASSTDRKTWLSWEDVQIAYDSDSDVDQFFDGVGFVLTPELGLCGWDFDHAFYPMDKEIDPGVLPLLNALKTVDGSTTCQA